MVRQRLKTPCSQLLGERLRGEKHSRRGFRFKKHGKPSAKAAQTGAKATKAPPRSRAPRGRGRGRNSPCDCALPDAETRAAASPLPRLDATSRRSRGSTVYSRSSIGGAAPEQSAQTPHSSFQSC